MVKVGGEEDIVTVSSSTSSGQRSVRLGRAFMFVNDLNMEVIRRRENDCDKIMEEIAAMEVGAETEEGRSGGEEN